jgi:hypothetical protein
VQQDAVVIAPPAPVTAAPAVPTLIKTFSATDAQGRTVEVQAVCLTDEYGRTVGPMSEQTGREIVEQLRILNALLAATQEGGTPLGQ